MFCSDNLPRNATSSYYFELIQGSHLKLDVLYLSNAPKTPKLDLESIDPRDLEAIADVKVIQIWTPEGKEMGRRLLEADPDKYLERLYQLRERIRCAYMHRQLNETPDWLPRPRDHDLEYRVTAADLQEIGGIAASSLDPVAVIVGMNGGNDYGPRTQQKFFDYDPSVRQKVVDYATSKQAPVLIALMPDDDLRDISGIMKQWGAPTTLIGSDPLIDNLISAGLKHARNWLLKTPKIRNAWEAHREKTIYSGLNS